MQAFRFTSIPRGRISRRPKITCELAATKPSTTPEPVPSSTTRGEAVDWFGDEEVALKR